MQTFATRFLLSLSLFGVFACQEASSPGRVDNKPARTESEAQEQAGNVPAQEKPQVDASTLRVFSSHVADLRNKSELIGSLSFEVDGRAEFILYELCPLEETAKKCLPGATCSRGGECFKGVTSYNRLRLPALYQGKILIKVNACVEREHSIREEFCGDTYEYTYNSQRFDAQLATILSDFARLKKDLRRLVEEDYRQTLAKFVEDANKCDSLNADVKAVLDSKARIVEQFLLAPASWFGQAGEDLADGVFGQGTTKEALSQVDAFGAALSKELSKHCTALGDKTHDKVCEVLKGFVTTAGGFLSALSPVQGLATMSAAIHDVYYGTFLGQGDKLVAKACYAEANLQRSVAAIKLQMEVKVNAIKTLKQELASREESPP